MKKLLDKLYTIFCMLKDFEIAMTSSVDNKFVLSYGNDVYICEIRKLPEEFQSGKTVDESMIYAITNIDSL